MTTVSANPTLLGDFVSTVSTPRTAAQTERTSLSLFNSSVAAGCPGRAVSVPALGQLWTSLDNMRINEDWLTTIKDELIKADVGEDGVATIDTSVVVTALAAKGLEDGPPVPVEFAPTTREIQPPTSGMVDDPINASNGNMVHHDLDVAFPAIAGALSITRTWNSLLADVPGVFGRGWSCVLDSRLDISGDSVVATMSEGNVIGFVPWEDGWIPPGVPRLSLDEPEDDDPDPTWVLHADHLRRFRFDAAGCLLGWEVGVARVVVERDEGGRVVRLRELVTGRSLAVRWHAGVIAEIVAGDGRTIAYERDDDGTITGARSDAGAVTYVWAGDLLVSVLDADGVALFTNVYDADRRVTSQTSPFGRVATYEYRDDGMTVFSDAAGVVQAMHHDRFGNLTGIVDVDGSAMRLAYNQRRQVVLVIERDGATWKYRYDGDDQIERIDPDGLSQTQVWDDRHRVVEAMDRAGNVTRMEYDTDHVAPSRVIQPNGGVIHQHLDERGLPTEIVDADGVVTRFEWDSDGQLVATRDAEGGVTSFDYDGAGYLRGIVPATGAPTVMELGAGGRVRRTVCGESTWEYSYTPAGRIDGGVEPGDVAWSATFGPHGAMASVSDATGATVTFDYDANGNITTTTAPDGAVYRHVYDEVGRLIAAIEPTGATTAKAYDRRGRLIEVTDPRGGTWQRTLDALGRTVSSTAPDGAVTSFDYDPNGYPSAVTGPDGRVWRTEHDHEGRPTAVVEPGGGRSVITYTPAGRLQSRTSPAGRTETFEYDRAGRLVATVGVDRRRRDLHRDARGRISGTVDRDPSGLALKHRRFRWDDGYRLTGITQSDDAGSATTSYARDSGGRVVEAVDPTGVRTQFAWDRRGLLTASTDPTGLRTTYEYDGRGLLTGLTAAGRTSQLAYGIDGRQQSITDPAGVVTSFRHDAAGALTGMRHGDGSGWDRTLDPCGRETSRRAPDGMIVGHFTYDEAGRLVTATAADSALTIEFLWDDDDRLEAVSGADGTRRIERDADGLVTATVDPDGTRNDYRRDGRGRLLGVDVGRPPLVGPSDVPGDGPGYDLAGRLTIDPGGTVYRYDDSARLAEISPLHGEPTTFEYGDDGLLIGTTGPFGRRRFHHDAAGRVVEVITDSGTIAIGYDAAGRRDREDHPDGTRTVYGWDDVGRLRRIGRFDIRGDVIGAVDVRYDALDRPAVVDGDVVGFDPITGLADGSHNDPEAGVPLGGVAVGDVFVVGARVLDPVTQQFLSTDPLLPLPGTNGSASGYTYGWQDPVNWVDPTGMRPISIEEFEDYQSENDKGTFTKAWEAIKEDPWGTLAMVGVTALGVGLCFVPGGQVVGAGILIGVASSAGVGLATGTFNPRMVALGGAMGAIPGGSTLRGAVAIGAASGAGETIGGSLLNGEGFPSGEQLLVGTLTGGALNGGGQAIRNALPNGSTAAASHAVEAERLATRVDEFHGALDPIAQNSRTTAVMSTSEGVDVVASGGRDLSPAQRALAQPDDVLGHTPGAHAEVTAIEAAAKNGLTPSQMAVSRPICPACQQAIQGSGGALDAGSTTSATWPR